MAILNPNEEQLREILATAKTVAIVGVSNKPDRASYQVAHYLRENTPYRFFYINPVLEELFGEKVYSSLADVPGHIDIVDVFRKSEDIPPVMDAAIEARVGTFWMQLGIENQDQADRGFEHGLNVVEDLCIKVEIARLKPFN
jgi:predicted CoA-binding protein